MEELKKLIDLKSIITIILVLVFSFLTITGKITPDQFLPILTMIITFYFAKKSETKITETKDDEIKKENVEE